MPVALSTKTARLSFTGWTPGRQVPGLSQLNELSCDQLAHWGISVCYAKRLSYVLVDISKEVNVLRLENFSAQKSVNGHGASSHMPILFSRAVRWEALWERNSQEFGAGGALGCEYVRCALVGLCNLCLCCRNAATVAAN